jgi:hypothetical protein
VPNPLCHAELTVDPEDLGRVIGKRGATAQSIRSLLRALGTKNEARYNLKIVDNGVQGSHKTSSDDDTGAVADEEAHEESSVVSNTRKELEELDDLDV